MPFSNSAIERAHDTFVSGLARTEADAVNELTAVYANLLRELKDDLRGLGDKIDEAKAKGEPISPSWLFQQNRYKDLILRTNRELANIANLNRRMLTDSNRKAVEAAEEYARKASHAQLERTEPVKGAAASVMANWNGLNAGAVKSIIGNVQPGSPLHTLINKNGADTGLEVQRALVRAVSTGKPGKEIAKDVQAALGGGLSRSMTIVRTEMHRAQREATRRSYEDNDDIVTEWIWRCARTTRTCAACWAFDGNVYETDVRHIGHVNCRCTMVPKTRSWGELGYPHIPPDPPMERGMDVFERLSEADKRKILGPGGYQLYKDKGLTIKQFAQIVHNPKWGSSVRVMPLREMRTRLGVPPPPKVVKVPKGAPPRTPQELMREQAAAVRDRVLREDLTPQDLADIQRLKAELEQLEKEADDAYVQAYSMQRVDEKCRGLPTVDERRACAADLIKKNSEAQARAIEKRKEFSSVRQRIKERQRDHIRVPVDDRTRVGYTVNPSNRLSKDEKEHLRQGFEVYNSFMSRSGRPTIDGRSVQVNILPKNGRAFQLGQTINVTRDEDLGVIAHEISHWMEQEDREAHVAVQRFLVQRSTDPVTGIRENLRSLKYNGGASDREQAWYDRFIHPYMGKDYHGQASEITTMGIQMFYEDPARLAKEDPEYFDFVYALFRGVDLTQGGTP